MMTDESLTAISKQSANVWWSEHLGRPIPAQVPPQAYFQPPKLDDPQVALPIVLALLGLLFTPFAWAAWGVAHHELGRVRAGAVSENGTGWLVFARGLGALLTLISFAMIAVLVAASRAR